MFLSVLGQAPGVCPALVEELSDIVQRVPALAGGGRDYIWQCFTFVHFVVVLKDPSDGADDMLSRERDQLFHHKRCLESHLKKVLEQLQVSAWTTDIHIATKYFISHHIQLASSYLPSLDNAYI